MSVRHLWSTRCEGRCCNGKIGVASPESMSAEVQSRRLRHQPPMPSRGRSHWSGGDADDLYLNTPRSGRPRRLYQGDLREQEKGVGGEARAVLREDREDDLCRPVVLSRLRPLRASATFSANRSLPSGEFRSVWTATSAWLKKWLSASEPLARLTMTRSLSGLSRSQISTPFPRCSAVWTLLRSKQTTRAPGPARTRCKSAPFLRGPTGAGPQTGNW